MTRQEDDTASIAHVLIAAWKSCIVHSSHKLTYTPMRNVCFIVPEKEKDEGPQEIQWSMVMLGNLEGVRMRKSDGVGLGGDEKQVVNE